MRLPWALAALFLAFAVPLAAAEDGPATMGDSPAHVARRALLIAATHYRNIDSLRAPEYDIKIISEKLTKAGYIVTEVKDPDTARQDIVDAFDTFERSTNPGDDVVVYYSGHGINFQGDDWLVPSDVPRLSGGASNGTIKSALISLRQLMSDIEDRQPAIQVWFVDACREDPFAKNGRPFAKSGGMGQIPANPKSLVFFSANYNQVALDRLPNDPPDVPSPFTRTVASNFDEWRDQYVLNFVKIVQGKVFRLVYPDPQLPVYEDATLGLWCFVRCNIQSSWRLESINDPFLFHPSAPQKDPEYVSFVEEYARGYRDHTWHVIVASPSSERDAKRLASKLNAAHPDLYFQETQSNPGRWMVTLGSGLGKAEADRLLPRARAIVHGAYEYCWGVGPTDPRGECKK